MQVRAAAESDAEQIAEIHVLGWQHGYRGLLPQALLDRLHPGQRVPRWQTTLRSAAWPGRGTLVAEDDGQLLGFTDLGPTRDDDQDPAEMGEIASFYVRPTAWRGGVGRQLMDTALATFVTAGYRTASLWVLDTNAPAIAFYTRLGFTPDGAVKDDIVGGAPIQDRRLLRSLEAPAHPDPSRTPRTVCG